MAETNNMMTLNIKLNPSANLSQRLMDASLMYIQTVNQLVAEMVENKATSQKSSKDINIALNSAVKNQAIQDAKSVFKKVKNSKYKIIPILKKPIVMFNNQNFSIDAKTIRIPLIIGGRSRKVPIEAYVDSRHLDIIKSAKKVGTLRIVRKNGTKWMAQIAITLHGAEEDSNNANVMGVDLGIKIPAVCKTKDGHVKFVGNGRMIKYKRRYHQTRRKALGKDKKLNAIKASKNKEQRWMQNQDHQISRSIIDFAIMHNVGVIRLEQLTNIRKTTRNSRKNNKSLHNWSFYRLAQFIKYKATHAGIVVEDVNPAYTSQICPNCRVKNKCKDRTYLCSDCGYTSHRDIVGAHNIINAPVACGQSKSA